MTITLLQGDCRDVLATLAAGSVQTCITSPPFYGLRRYNVEGAQIGIESSPAAYVAALVDVFRLVRRVLRDDGTVWLNLGDSYVSSATGSLGDKITLVGGQANQAAGLSRPDKTGFGIAEKNLIGIPWAVAFALRDDGWYLRSAITWCKGNPMPESVRDRPTSATEMIFLLAKQPRYFYDATAIAEAAIHAGKEIHTNGNSGMDAGYDGHRTRDGFRRGVTVGATRNRRNWWVVNSQPFSGAHFATFPEKLVEPMVLAGSSPRACEVCGAPWERVVEKELFGADEKRPDRAVPGRTGNGHQKQRAGDSSSITTGWRPTCAHANEGAARCVVLDPFAGSGTTCRVAERYGRDSIGIDLGYLDLAEKRTDGVQVDMESLL